MLSRCGEQYRRRYVEGEIIPPGVALITGRGVHLSAEANLKHWIATKDYLPHDEALALAYDAVTHDWAMGEIRYTEDERKQGAAKVKAEALDKAVRLAGLHHKELAPTLHPLDVEYYWRIELGNFPFDLAGVVDVKEAETVRDLKTTGRTPSQDTASNSLQLTFYALHFYRTEQRVPQVGLDYLVDLKTPKVVTLYSGREQYHFEAALRRVEIAAQVIEKGLFIPARPDDWACTPGWCGYWHTCKYAHGFRQYVIEKGESNGRTVASSTTSAAD
jgi:hypothetical protein